MSRNLNYRKAIVAFVAMVSFLFTGVAVAPAASADGTSDGVVYGTPVVAVGAAVDTTTVSTVVSAYTKYTEVMNIMAAGLPKYQQKTCVTLTTVGRTYKLGGKRFKIGMKYYTDYWAWRAGKRVHVWHWKIMVKGDKFCLNGRTIRRAQCGNLVAYTPPAGTITGTIKLVRAFTLKASATAKSVSDVKVTASAHCDSGYSQATASASAHATATASAYAYAYAHTALQVIAAAKAAARLKLTVAIKEASKVVAIAKATTLAQAEVSVMVQCTAVPPPPPVNHPPTISIVNGPQHVIVNDTIQLCALASDPDGDNVLVTFDAKYGTTSTPFRPDPAGAPQKWCTTYTAPADTHTDEVITANVTDGQLSATASTAPFPIAADVGF